MFSQAQRLVSIQPTPRQLQWQRNEFTAFFHYGINTYTDREWGDGTESPSLFNPAQVDTDQWCQVLADAGIRACILTAKHHDGFCLWDTKHTQHSVMQSPYGRDIARQLSDSCQKYNIKLGFYLSPWDRNHPSYGTGTAYDDYFCAQLTELVTQYGPLYSLWFDGANGEGKNGRVQLYDWDRYFNIIRAHQPEAAISICGPDVRWCGNEAGQWRPSEWSVVPAALQDMERIHRDSQTSDDPSFREKRISSSEEDLGSRERLQAVEQLVWYPCEIDVSIRPGWFYHDSEDSQVRSLDNLLSIYEHSAGGNGVLLLNIPPARDGRIHEADATRLQELGAKIQRLYGKNVAATAHVSANEESTVHVPENILNEEESYWTPDKDTPTATLTLTLSEPQPLHRAVLREQIRLSQRVEAFELYAWVQGEWALIHTGTTIGHKKMCRLPGITTDRIQFRILQSRVKPIIQFVGLYAEADD